MKSFGKEWKLWQIEEAYAITMKLAKMVYNYNT
jgi:hypothetical protein